MVTKRQSRLLDILSNAIAPMTGKTLGQMLGVSDRTIRSDVDAVNTAYRCKLIVASRHSGYSVDHDLMKALNISSKDSIPQTAHQRCVYLINELLFQKREINLIDLQERVFVSGYSIDNDLRKIREIISEYPSLRLKRLQNHIRLYGEEEDKRQLYKKLLLEETKGNFSNLNAIAALWKDFDLLQLEEDFSEICEKHGYHIMEMAYPLLLLHIGISIERMRSQNYVAEDESSEEEDSCEYQIAEELFSRIAEIYKVRPARGEILRFAELLCGKGKTDMESEEYDEGLKNLLEEILAVLRQEFDIDLSEDEEFRRGILGHIRLFMKRWEKQVESNDMYLQELKRSYPLVFEMAVRVAWCIERYCGTRLNENEITFLALHLGAACERLDNTEPYRVVAIIPNSYTIVRPCVDKLQLRFGSRIKMVRVYSFVDKAKVLRDAPDLIVTTVPLKHQLGVPIVQISLFFNSEDESRVFQMLNLLDKKRYHKDFVKLIQRLTSKELFFIRPSMESREEILHFLCDKLEEKGLSEANFRENVFKREALSDTSFVYGFAVPHAIEVSTRESCISIMVLREPVKWGSYPVSLVVLLSIMETDTQLLKVFFDWLCNIVTDNNRLQKLVSAQSFEEFMERAME